MRTHWSRSSTFSKALAAAGVGIGIAVLLGMVLYLHQHWPSLARQASDPRPSFLAGAGVLLFAAYGLNATCWHRVAAIWKFPTSWRFDAQVWCASLVWKYVPGKVWQGASRWQAYRHADVASNRFIPAFMLEQLLTLTAAIATALMFAATVARQYAGTAVLTVLIGCACIAGACFSIRRYQRGSTLLEPLPIPVLHWGASVALCLLLQTSALLLLGGGLLLLYGGVFGPMHLSLLWPFTAGLAIAGLAGVLAFFVPSGIGIREASLAWILTDFIPGEQAIALALACRIWITGGEALLAIGALCVRDSFAGDLMQ